MPEIVLRLCVQNRSARPSTDVYWQRVIETGFLPIVGDHAMLWGAEDGVLSPVKRRWWRTDGRVLAELADMVVDGAAGGSGMGPDGVFRWVPWSSAKGDVAELLSGAGWKVLDD